jgi:hypothetical protein
VLGKRRERSDVFLWFSSHYSQPSDTWS